MEKIILLHGALGSSKQLDSLKEKLKNSFDVYSFNFEGHGGRPSNSHFSIALFVQNTLDFLIENNLSKVSFFGYSMGGYVALKLAQTHPEKVEQIITYGTKFDWTIEKAEKEVRMLNPEKIEEKIPHYADFLKNLHQPLDWKMVMNETAKMMTDLGKNPALAEEDLKSIKTKTTICVGSNDQMVSIEESKETASLLLDSELVILNDMTHPIEKLDLDILIKYIC